MTHTVGDAPTLDLTVTPHGVDTSASATARTPAGVTVPLTVTPHGIDTSEWSTRVPLTEPGEWVVTWLVVGTGAGTTRALLAVAPPAGSDTGRSYATTAQLAEHLQAAPPPGAARLLRRATVEIDHMLRTAIYDVDDAGLPTDTAVAKALADAVCEQVEWWGELGDASGSGAVAALAGSQIGTVKLGSGASAGGASLAIAPGAHRALRLAGLLNQGPRIPGSQLGPR